jgi:cytochrome c-type biogenesis protein CcmH/NrfF
MLYVAIIAHIVQALQIFAVSTFTLWVLPSVYLLVREEISITMTNYREMREDHRENRQRMDRLVRDAEIRWEKKMGVKTSG